MVRRVLGLTTFMVLVVACTTEGGSGGPSANGGADGGGGNGGGGGSADADAACRRYYDALQGFLGRCVGNSTVNPAADHVERDRDRFASFCVKAFEIPGTSVTPSVITSCAAAVDARSDCHILSDIDVETCYIGPGSLDDGAPCLSSTQCKGYCKKEPSTGGMNVDCGRCAPRAAAGGACTSSTECPPRSACIEGTCGELGGEGASCSLEMLPACKGGFRCETTTQKCVAEKPSGATCDSAVECGAPLDCIAGTCRAKLAEGEDCTGEITGCGRGLHCVSATKKCTLVAYKAPGEPCDRELARCDRGSCAIPAGATTGVCPTILADGAACVRGDRNAVCDAYASCIDGTCQVPGTQTCQ